jgi:hypothetical protein
MKLQIQYWAIWLAAKIQIVGADFDPEVLQWPGGSLIAPLLWLYATIASAWEGSPRAARPPNGLKRSTVSLLAHYCSWRAWYRRTFIRLPHIFILHQRREWFLLESRNSQRQVSLVHMCT